MDNAQVASWQTRGVVLTPGDLSWGAWPARAKAAGLNTFALHPFPGQVEAFVASEAGQAFLDECRALGLAVEYELHALGELLPRALFAQAPDLFRMNEQGERVPDWNLCIHNPRALALVAENAVRIAERLRPTTGRYFFWGDDGQPWCRCPQCRGLSESDQALILENVLLGALRRVDPAAQLAHLAYLNTLPPPSVVRPAPGVFLEFAPIRRRFDVPLRERAARLTEDAPTHGEQLDLLEANLAWFGRETAQVLEYWLDVSRFSHWKRPAVRLPWNRTVLEADLETYAARGIRHVTSFAVWLDAAYVASYGEPPLGEYGEALGARI